MKSSFMEWDPHKDVFLLQALWADVIPDTYGTFALQHIGNPVFFSTHKRSCHAVCLPSIAPLYHSTHQWSCRSCEIKIHTDLV